MYEDSTEPFLKEKEFSRAEVGNILTKKKVSINFFRNSSNNGKRIHKKSIWIAYGPAFNSIRDLYFR